MSSPSSEFKRPLASLTFAGNFLLSGGDASAMKLTNIFIHLLNGLTCFFLTRRIIRALSATQGVRYWRPGIQAGLTAMAWLLLPINLTAVLYVVQRMESLANLAVFLGLLGYLKGRMNMRLGSGRGLALVLASMIFAPLVGVLAKETAILMPLYALCIEVAVFQGKTLAEDGTHQSDPRVRQLFIWLLAIPFVLGLIWISFKISNPRAWASRDFTLTTRLLSECRIVFDYIVWTLFPRASDLSFYHDSFSLSRGWTNPVTTLLAAVGLAIVASAGALLRRRLPLVTLGIAFFFACQSLTATIIPLELIYEHRNYFASYGLLLAAVPILVSPRIDAREARPQAGREPVQLARRVLFGALLLYWAGQTWMTASAWGTPLGLARELADRNPASPRAQYELGRMFIILSNYDPSSPFVALAYPPLEKAASLPKSSILPEQALIFLNARMHLPLRDAWWDSMNAKLKTRRPGIQDESALGALARCAINDMCDLPRGHMVEAFVEALSHPNPTARLLAMYSDYAWGELGDLPLAYRMIKQATATAPTEPAYMITRTRIAIQLGEFQDADAQVRHLEALNIGGSLDGDIVKLKALMVGVQKP